MYYYSSLYPFCAWHNACRYQCAPSGILLYLLLKYHLKNIIIYNEKISFSKLNNELRKKLQSNFFLKGQMVNTLDYMDKMQLESVTNIQLCLSIMKSAKTTHKWVSMAVL